MSNSVILRGRKVPLAVQLADLLAGELVGWLLADPMVSQVAAAISCVNPKSVYSDQGGKILYSFQSAAPKPPGRSGG